MAKSRKKSTTPRWTDGLDETEVGEALVNATVDAHDAYEQHTGLLTAIQDELEFPFKVQVLGDIVTVLEMVWPENDEFGLDLVVKRNGQRHCIEARSVNLVPPFPDGHLYLAAYLDWRGRL